MPEQEVRDAVHGLIRFSDQEWEVVNTRAFQRLRGIQQLAMTHLVYTGARHSRFEHCMGACHVAGQLGDQIRDHGLDELDTSKVRLAALVHDLGHGPFSHVSEEVFERFTGQEHVHEKVSAAIVERDDEVRKALGAETAAWIAALLSGRGHGASRSVERDIVAGPADIDKLDYLLRDSLYCGVNYGRYDLDKVIESARGLRDAGGSVLAFHEDGLYALEEMLLARYHMHRQVYGHRTRVGIDRMLVRAMTLGVEEEVLPKSVFVPPDRKTRAFVAEYLEWDDAEVIKTLCRAEGSRAGDLMRALVTRKLLKRVGYIELDDLAKEFGRRLAGYAAAPEDDVLEAHLDDVEARIAGAAGVDPHWVVLHWDQRKSPLSTRLDVRVMAEDVLLVDSEGKATMVFQDKSELFGSGERGAQASVSLYLRPPRDRRLSQSRQRKVEKAMLEGLELIGTATEEV